MACLLFCFGFPGKKSLQFPVGNEHIWIAYTAWRYLNFHLWSMLCWCMYFEHLLKFSYLNLIPSMHWKHYRLGASVPSLCPTVIKFDLLNWYELVGINYKYSSVLIRNQRITQLSLLLVVPYFYLKILITVLTSVKFLAFSSHLKNGGFC